MDVLSPTISLDYRQLLAVYCYVCNSNEMESFYHERDGRNLRHGQPLLPVFVIFRKFNPTSVMPTDRGYWLISVDHGREFESKKSFDRAMAAYLTPGCVAVSC